jgi:hypothetical protein
MPGAGRTRQPCVQKKVHFAHARQQQGSRTSDIPCAMVLTVAPRSPWCAGLVSHHRSAKRPAKLYTSVGVSGPHGLAVRLLLIRPRQGALSQKRPPHPAPNVRDDRETSLLIGGETGADNHIFPKNGREIFLPEGLDTNSENPPSGKSIGTSR